MTPPGQRYTFISDPNHTQNLSGRVTAACQNCHQKKIKCSGDISCDQCRHRGISCPGPSKRKRPSKSEAGNARPPCRRRGSPASAPADSIHSASPSPVEGSHPEWARQQAVPQYVAHENAMAPAAAVWSQDEAFIHPLPTPHQFAMRDNVGVSSLSDEQIAGQPPTIRQHVNTNAAVSGNFQPYGAASYGQYVGLPDTPITTSNDPHYMAGVQPSWDQKLAGSSFDVSQTYYEVNSVNNLSPTTTVSMVQREQFYPGSSKVTGEGMWDSSTMSSSRIDFGNPSPLSPPEEGALAMDYMHMVPHNSQQLHATYGMQPGGRSEMTSAIIYYEDALPPGMHRNEYKHHDPSSVPRQP